MKTSMSFKWTLFTIKLGYAFRDFFSSVLVLTAIALMLGGIGIVVWDLTDDCAIPYWGGIIAFVLGLLVISIHNRFFPNFKDD